MEYAIKILESELAQLNDGFVNDCARGRRARTEKRIAEIEQALKVLTKN